MQPYERLERDLARWAGFEPENVVACSSGTAALHLALEAMDLPSGSRVIVPDYTMIACPRAVSMAGMVPTFVDCKPDLTINEEKVAECIERHDEDPNDSRVTAIMAVHVYGRSCDMSAITDIAGKYELWVIEDLAEAHGMPPHPLTDAACYSFYRNKIVAGEEGGAVILTNEDYSHRARMLRSLGFTADHDYTHIPRGHNYRLANTLASLIGASLAQVKTNTAKRWAQYDIWDSACPNAWRMAPPDQPWVYSFRVPGMWPELQTAVVRAVQGMGVEARHGFKPCRRQEEYLSAYDGFEWESDRAAREVVYLPVDRPVSEELAGRVFGKVKELVG